MTSAIAAPQPAAAEEGAKILQAGGNAIDAAVACACVQAIIDPHACGIGGYAVATLTLPGETESQTIGLDAPALAGAKVSPEMWQDKLIRPNPEGWGYFLKGMVNEVGYTSICTPGWLRAMDALLDRYGTLSLAEAMQPAIRIAEEGYILTERAAMRWKSRASTPETASALDKLTMHTEASRVLLKADKTPYDTGEVLRNPDYANTFRHVAQYGADDFYTGELAQRMSNDIAQNHGNVTADDFAAYTLRENTSISGTYRGYTITSATAPHGGPTLLAILNILEGYDLTAYDHNSPDYIYLVAMAMKAAFADRNPYMADPNFEDIPLDWMISKERAAYWRDRIDRGEPINVSFTATEPPDTTHVSVIDKHGIGIALTHSLGASSGVITPGLGFMYNNSMINFHPLPGHPNSILPGKGRTTGMAPTIVYQEGQPRIVLGSPGATRIITSNLQVILNVLDFCMDIQTAINMPRIDCQAGNIRCQMRIPDYVCAEVNRRYPTLRIPQSHGGFALVNAITKDPTTGQLAGGVDTGSDGMALLV